ncbi:hypothetical protein G8764_02955 [Pseudomaricurvus alcaniphilus]|uniref:hypothetical protein n=1 Tax=Pseudomaricurvus alcaniphilus TaxID=1166482 RepID=UPI001407C1EB|nr:hypothetical protein [Pseudomaricurvus alcaniphilus]NHN36248.1 hypothetical protein [Pseudomaricurvus alcaniphilus]
MAATQGPRKLELLALGLLSATLLAYQLWLTRVIAIQHWHHLAALVIALALLGFGVAGVLLSLYSDNARRRYRIWLHHSALATAVALAAGIALASRLPLNMLALPWQWQQVAWLLLYAVCLVPVFFCGALFVTVCFVRWPRQAGRIYAVDLLAAAAGALLILPLIDWLGLRPSLGLLLLLPLLAALLLGAGHFSGRRRLASILAGVLAVALVATVPIAPAQYKAQAQRLLERDSRVLLQRDGLSQQYVVLDTPALHDAPGLSLSSSYQAPRQWQLLSNGDNPVPLLLAPLPPAQFYQQLLGYAPYVLRPGAERALQLEVDTLWQSWISAGAGVRSLHMVCANGEVIALLRELRQRQGGGIYPAALELQQIAPRRYLAAAGPGFDVIALAVASPEAGMAATQENYLLTREGLGAAFDRLQPGGVLAIDLQLHSLPRELLKLVNTVAAILQQRQLPATDHLAIVRDWRNAVLLVSSTAIDAAGRARLRSWSQQHQFDLAALPGLAEEDSNRFHQLSENYYQPLQRLLAGASLNDGEHESLFELRPATDKRPFFFHFMRWSTLAQWLHSGDDFWRAQLDWGYLLAFAALFVGAVLAIGLLLLPLWLGRRRSLPPYRVAGYFAAIGLGFMFVEIGLLQQATLLLDATAVSMSAVLAALLTGAGCGSLLQQRWHPSDRVVRRLLVAVALLAPLTLPLLQGLFGLAAQWPLAGRVLLAVLPLLLLAVLMGFALPHGLARLAAAPAASIAWVWALNGFSSVLGAVGASLIAVHWGLPALILVASGCYLGATLALAQWR